MGIHIWKYLDLHSAYIIVGFGLKWNSYAGTLTTKRIARLITLYMREHMYATVSTVRNKFFLSLWGHTERACIMIINNYIVPPLINFLLGYVTLLHYGLVSHQVVHVNGADGTHNADRSQVHRRQSSPPSACSTYPSAPHVYWRVWDGLHSCGECSAM